jgi:glycosyltransferase involved in cell wall biosynthesis
MQFRDPLPARTGKSLKILHAAETMKGGVGTVLKSLLDYQTASFGAGNVVAVVPDEHVDHLAGIEPASLHLFRRNGRNPKSLIDLGRALRRAVAMHRPDVVHLHSSLAGAVGRALLAPRLSRPAVVYTPHAFPFMMASEGWKRRTYRGLEAGLSRFADAIVCVSDFELQAGLAAGLKPDRLRRIYNGVSTVAGASLRSRPAAGERPVQLLFVGRLDRQKGFDVLLEAMSKLPADRFHLTVVGAGVKQSTHEAAVSNIDYAGWVAPSDVGGFYDRADVVVVPSRWEGFAMVPLEALSRGAAVVATRCCSMPELIAHNDTGLLFDVDDAATLAQLLRDTPIARWHAMAQAGRRRVETEFSNELMQDKTVELYQSLLPARSTADEARQPLVIQAAE